MIASVRSWTKVVESQKGGGRETDNDLDGLGGGEVGSGAFNGQSCVTTEVLLPKFVKRLSLRR